MRRHHTVGAAVGALAMVAVVAVALVWAGSSPQQQAVLLKSADKSSFPLKKITEPQSVSGKPCWACPCCNGCEKTGAAKAADCGLPAKKAATHSAGAAGASDPEFTPVQQQLVKQMVDSALEEHGLRGAGVHAGHQLAWKHMGVTVVDGDWSMNKTRNRDYDEHHQYKRVGRSRLEDTLQPSWFGGKDWFEPRRRHLSRGGAGGRYQPWHDPSGLWSDSPVDQAPWQFASARHWDRNGPEAPDGSWEEAEGRRLDGEGAMRHGAHQHWADLPNPQWGWESQFADWDPVSHKNSKLVFGDGSARGGTPPWELSFIDPKLYGDDFIPEAASHAKYSKEENNRFADWEARSGKNEDLVWGHHEGSLTGLRLHTRTPVKDNWNPVADSEVKADQVGARVDGGADVSLTYPDEGTPASHFFSEWDKVPNHKEHVVWDAGSEDGPLADSRLGAAAEQPPAQAQAQSDYTPDQKRGFQ